MRPSLKFSASVDFGASAALPIGCPVVGSNCSR
jgi:hypothetical protein